MMRINNDYHEKVVANSLSNPQILRALKFVSIFFENFIRLS